MEKKAITIGRQYGSGGRQVGQLLAGRLGIPYYDNELLAIAAEKYGINPGLLREHDERRMDSLLFSLSVQASARHYDRMALPYEMYQAQCDTIRRLAQEGPCVFIGRCADEALRDVCPVLRVFIYASSLDARIQRAVSVDGVAPTGAPAAIRRKDQQRRAYYNTFTGREWGKMENYDVCLNSTTLGYEGCAAAIAAML